MDHLIRSLGHGVYHVTAETSSSAAEVAGQIGPVLESWADPEERDSNVVLLSSGFPTSKFEAAVVGDPDVASSVRRAAATSPPGSLIRIALKSVAEACALLSEGKADAPSLEP